MGPEILHAATATTVFMGHCITAYGLHGSSMVYVCMLKRTDV